jgi:GTP-binding protein HflX
LPEEIHGATRNLKPAQVTALQHLYRRRVQPTQVISPQLATTLAELSRELGLQLGLLLSRKGLVVQVIVGEARGLKLPELGRNRAGEGRLRGLRLVHTHLDGEPLSEEDLTDLARLRLDLLSLLQVKPDGLPGELHSAHLLPENPDQRVHQQLPPESVHAQTLVFDEFIGALEAEISRKADLLRGAQTGEAALALHVAIPGGRSPEASLRELSELARTAGVAILETAIQRRPAYDPRTLAGRGKLDELTQRALQLDVELLLVDHDLAPGQVRAICETTDLNVVDRTTLILDIFAQHAKSREGKLQVELAQLRYLLPRLSGKYGALMRQSGGIGARRGPGEKKLELDRRRIQERIHRLEKELESVSRHRQNRRGLRRRRAVPVVALVGYTNAGKSTLLNLLTGATVLAEDKLFATLDPTSRRLRFPQEREVIFTDTVGFIHDLPRELVRAFRATLEELEEADLLLHVVDAADPDRQAQLQAVEQILEELQLTEIPRLVLLNKMDRVDPAEELFNDLQGREALPVCALQAETTRPLLRRVEQILWERNRLDEPWEDAAAPPERGPDHDEAGGAADG